MAEALARRGASVLIAHCREPGLANAVVARIRAFGGIALSHDCDCSIVSETQALITRAVGEWGRLDHISYGGKNDFNYAEDVANIFIAAARASFEGGAILNLHGSAAIEVAAPEMKGLPFPDELDGEPLARLIGPLPITPLEEAVAWTIGRFRELVEAGQMAAGEMLT